MILALLLISADLDRTIQDAVDKNQIPGAVVQIGKPGQVLHKKAYGSRAIVPAREAMTEDTIFDAASLTKVIATTSCLMRLFEQGRIRLSDPVTAYLPEFQGGKSEITIRQLMTHYSGLRPDLDLKPEWSGYETGIKLALADRPVAAPGEKFIYSDINFILLGEIVRRLSGKTLPDFAHEQIYAPLGMSDTTFNPPNEWKLRIAPTEQEEGMSAPLRGVVHDPTSRYMGGVAGHAGLFTTAADLGKFAEMMLNEGVLNGTRIFSSAVVRRFTSPASPPLKPDIRALGWDIDSRYSANRGEIFPVGSYGHTGFTGTSLWIDPGSRTYVVLLANSVHPKRRPPISSLRSRVASLAAIDTQVSRNGVVYTGLDVLAQDGFASLKGKRVGLITNHTGLSREGKRNIDLMAAAGVKIEAIYSPEHGIAGKEDKEEVGDSRDSATGIPIVSIYNGPQRKPPTESLKKLDLLLFDIQDVGARFYTYMCTMLDAMQEAAKLGLAVMVLDRPNPITGTHVDGPVLEAEYASFVGCYTLPLRHGMTLGEIATMANAEKKWGVRLEVVKMRGWLRTDWFDSTGLIWVNPSPSIRNLNASLVYPGVAMLEYSKNYSVGRGTVAPFEQIGAPWVDGPALADYLNVREIPGVRFLPTRFQPESGNFAGQTINGVRILVTDREFVSSSRLGVEIAAALHKLYPDKIDFQANRKLIANRGVIDSLAGGEKASEIQEAWKSQLTGFHQRRKAYLLY